MLVIRQSLGSHMASVSYLIMIKVLVNGDELTGLHAWWCHRAGRKRKPRKVSRQYQPTPVRVWCSLASPWSCILTAFAVWCSQALAQDIVGELMNNVSVRRSKMTGTSVPLRCFLRGGVGGLPPKSEMWQNFHYIVRRAAKYCQHLVVGRMLCTTHAHRMQYRQLCIITAIITGACVVHKHVTYLQLAHWDIPYLSNYQTVMEMKQRARSLERRLPRSETSVAIENSWSAFTILRLAWLGKFTKSTPMQGTHVVTEWWLMSWLSTLYSTCRSHECVDCLTKLIRWAPCCRDGYCRGFMSCLVMIVLNRVASPLCFRWLTFTDW